MADETKPQSAAEPLEQPFRPPSERRDDAVFPEQLEKDPEVFLPGTEQRALRAIRDESFRMPPPDKAQSVSFSRTSGLALGYPCGKRSEASPEGVVIAVRFGPSPGRPILRVYRGRLQQIGVTF